MSLRYQSGETELQREVRRHKESLRDDDRGKAINRDLNTLVSDMMTAPKDESQYFWQRYNVDIRSNTEAPFKNQEDQKEQEKSKAEAQAAEVDKSPRTGTY
jgi:hypothetical protein